MQQPEVGRKTAFDFIRYASLWEDADVLGEALRPVAAGGKLLSIASAGDNALALLTLDPALVVAADLNPAQLACVELRVAAFKRLSHPELLGFLGVQGDTGRPATYQRLRSDLSPAAAGFWDAHSQAIAGGIIHAGKFERFLRAFGRWVLPLVHRKSTRLQLLSLDKPEEQETFFAQRWDTWPWRALFRVFFSRKVTGWLGRSPAFFDQVEGEVSLRILDRVRLGLTKAPARTNPYLRYIFTGSYAPEALPLYLRPQHFEAIRSRLDRLRLFQGPVQATGLGPFDGFNLSDIFEYMNPAESEACYRALLDQARPKARLVYWNMLVPRSRPAALAGRSEPLTELSAALHLKDQAFFYQALHIDEVRP
jgi:S-adenosylmethionine-diacylglycerol 3-amino-3-carboxypropyl transferase